jgi:hypothetical protein
MVGVVLAKIKPRFPPCNTSGSSGGQHDGYIVSKVCLWQDEVKNIWFISDDN